LLGILIFKGFTARRLYKSFGVKGLILLFSVVFYLVRSVHIIVLGWLQIERLTKALIGEGQMVIAFFFFFFFADVT
jgi:hypothetical protein